MISVLSISRQSFWFFRWIARISSVIVAPYRPKSKQVHNPETEHLKRYFLATSRVVAPGILSKVCSNRSRQTLSVMEAAELWQISAYLVTSRGVGR